MCFRFAPQRPSGIKRVDRLVGARLKKPRHVEAGPLRKS
jgi:hypothetical protein